MALEPTESIDNEITVLVLESPGQERLPCSSFSEAIATVKRKTKPGRVLKIEDQDEEIVLNSELMDIEDCENEWNVAKRRLGVDMEEHDCQYNNAGCVADDLCPQCKMDKIQRQY